MKQTFCIMLFVAFSFSVNAQAPTYSFFSAGHTYGSPLNHHYGLHYPFVDYIPTINNYPNMEFGFLTGDVVVSPTVEYWDSAQITISQLNMPIFIAAGNHDISQEFINRFDTYYSSFVAHNDLFIILTPGLNAWNIEGAQLDFLTSTLDSNYEQVNNIFIMLHELIWWSPDNEYSSVDINYEPHYPGSTNFNEVVKPLLLSYPNKITLYAGDLGCTNQVSPYMYDTFDNVTLIASGMGGGVRDNIIITDVYPDSIHYNLVAINGDNPNALGELTDFILLSIPELEKEVHIGIYPNPAKRYLNFKTDSNMFDFKFEIYDNTGKLQMSAVVNNRSNLNINTLAKGMYLYKIYTENKVLVGKFVKQ